MSEIRLDKYLWAVRVFKTRSDAADAIRNNRVLVNDAYAKPSREVKVGDMISVRRERGTGRPTKKERREIDALMDGFYFDEEELE